jgi:hypothetical protein
MRSNNMPRGRPKKVEFADLDQEFKDTVAAMKDEEIKNKMAAVSIAEHENQTNKKLDQDLEEKKMAFALAGELYREATKANKLRISYCYSILEARGQV